VRILIDTNLLISAAYSKSGFPNQAYKKAVEPPYHAVVCEQSIEEFRRIFNRKFPNKIHAFESFIASALSVITVIPVPLQQHFDEAAIRDVNDRPILRAAIQANVDIIITGDKDFLESGLKSPKIMTAAEFVMMD
jgi:putative PIN family toxin of toxin-antitoxin system